MEQDRSAGVDLKQSDGEWIVRLTGNWELTQSLPSSSEIENQLASGAKWNRLRFETDSLGNWDTGLLTFLQKLIEASKRHQIDVDPQGIPAGARRILDMASAVPERGGARKGEARQGFLEKLGSRVLEAKRSSEEMVEFVGEAFMAFAKFLVGKATFRRSDLLLLLQECGAQALPIVSLICVLVGLILAFVGAIQLKMFGAQIFVADVVGIGMVRVMGAIMTGIIMAGRTGAAFAAQIGTMQVNEEIDALKTLGISPIEFLVLPRMIALIIMMPLLCLYADLMGILGGMAVALSMLDLNPTEYLTRTREAITLTTVAIGVFHSAVFGVLVALSGCLRGIQCGRSASAVGYATTSAVVTSIVSIIMATAIITFACQVLGI